MRWILAITLVLAVNAAVVYAIYFLETHSDAFLDAAYDTLEAD
jgi:hypothetical protein